MDKNEGVMWNLDGNERNERKKERTEKCHARANAVFDARQMGIRTMQESVEQPPVSMFFFLEGSGFFFFSVWPD